MEHPITFTSEELRDEALCITEDDLYSDLLETSSKVCHKRIALEQRALVRLISEFQRGQVDWANRCLEKYPNSDAEALLKVIKERIAIYKGKMKAAMERIIREIQEEAMWRNREIEEWTKKKETTYLKNGQQEMD